MWPFAALIFRCTCLVQVARHTLGKARRTHSDDTLLRLGLSSLGLGDKGSFKGDIDIDIDIDVEVDVYISIYIYTYIHT